jgi:hypothetical protein
VGQNTCLRRIESRGALDTAHRAHQNCGQIFRYPIATRRAERDPAADLRGALPPVNGGHFATITDPSGIGALEEDIIRIISARPATPRERKLYEEA